MSVSSWSPVELQYHAVLVFCNDCIVTLPIDKHNENSVLLYLYHHNVNSMCSAHIATDKALFFNQNVFIFFLFLHENICCGTH